MQRVVSSTLAEAMDWMHTQRSRGWIEIKVYFYDGHPDRHELTTMTSQKLDAQ